MFAFRAAIERLVAERHSGQAYPSSKREAPQPSQSQPRHSAQPSAGRPSPEPESSYAQATNRAGPDPDRFRVLVDQEMKEVRPVATPGGAEFSWNATHYTDMSVLRAHIERPVTKRLWDEEPFPSSDAPPPPQAAASPQSGPQSSPSAAHDSPPPPAEAPSRKPNASRSTPPKKICRMIIAAETYLGVTALFYLF